MQIALVKSRSTAANALRSAQPGDSTGVRHPLHPMLALQRQSGNYAVQQLLRSGGIQAKLTISQPGDVAEQEADRVADHIMRAPAGFPISSTCSCSAGDENCESCQQTASMMPRRPDGNNHSPAHATSASANSFGSMLPNSPGQHLDSASRAFFEPRFGRDFSDVRLHTGSAAAESAQSIDALAYTMGQNIVFAPGRYNPHSSDGRMLLAHELTHVVQQGRSLPERRTSGDATAQRTVDFAADSDTLFRQAAPEHCSAIWSCASGNSCEQPDVAGSGTASANWRLDLNIDTDVPASTDIRGGADVGHTYVVFSESNGAQYSYGFYPRPEEKPSEFKTTVNGCVVHPDTSHRSCVDYTKSYTLSQGQYRQGLRFAQTLCKAPERYDLLSWNCTTAAVAIAKEAGQTPPSAKGSVASGVAEADNPNTLKDNYLDQDIPTRHLQSDKEIRDWVSASPISSITALSTSEKLRMLNRLLDGWISEPDLSAFEKICAGITDAAERKTVQTAIGPREAEVTLQSQRQRVHEALFGKMFTPAPVPGVNPPSPQPPR